MNKSKLPVNSSLQNSRIKQKYGFLTGNYEMFEEGRKEIIRENEMNENDETPDGHAPENQDAKSKRI